MEQIFQKNYKDNELIIDKIQQIESIEELY